MSQNSDNRRIELTSFNPEWRPKFEEEARELKKIFTHNLGIHHIGSTAVYGIKAKPVIDILIVVEDIRKVKSYTGKMEKLGYSHKGENGIAGRRYFEKGSSPAVHTHHVHVFEDGDREIARHLQFRDYLNAHPEEAEAYSALKEKLARKYRTDPAGYTEAKSDFISDIDKKAKRWKS